MQLSTNDTPSTSYLDAILTSQKTQPEHSLKAALAISPVIDTILKNNEAMRRRESIYTERSTKLVELKKAMEEVRARQAGLFGCEAQLRDILQTQWQKLAEQAEAVTEELPTRDMDLDFKYPRKLNKEVLRWRTADGWPALGLFRLDEPTLSFGRHLRSHIYNVSHPENIKYDRKTNSLTSAHLRGRFGEYYQDVMQHVDEIAPEINKHISWRMTDAKMYVRCTFSGYIPESARQDIRQAEASKYFDGIYLLTETPMWKVVTEESEGPPPARDPIALGWDGKDLRVICVFDTTSLEELALKTR